MPSPKIQVFGSLEDLSRSAAARFAALANTSAEQAGIFSCALSGGSTPRRLYELLATAAYRIPWEKVHLFQVDERCVPPDDAESNYRMIREALLEKAAIPKTNFHRMAAERPDREAAARDYEAEISRVQGRAGETVPRLGLVFLGMGSDGHTASLFPGSTALEEQLLLISENFSPRLGKFRLTMTFPLLNAADEVIFLVSGGDKAETLREVLEGPAGKFPAQAVQPAHGRLTWFVERSAARLLSPATLESA